MTAAIAPILEPVQALRPCPDCSGRGEIETGFEDQPEHTKYPNPAWEPWEPDVTECVRCSGVGQVELTRCQGLECGDWFDPDEQGCVHGQPLCDEHRPECRECMADAREDAATDPWGGA